MIFVGERIIKSNIGAIYPSAEDLLRLGVDTLDNYVVAEVHTLAATEFI